MLSKSIINAILVGIIATASMGIQISAGYSKWYSPIITAILTGIIVAIKEYLTAEGTKSIGANYKNQKKGGTIRYYISLIGIY